MPRRSFHCEQVARILLSSLALRQISKDLIFRLKMVAAAEHRTVKGFILALIEERIQELEKKGLLPKGK